MSPELVLFVVRGSGAESDDENTEDLFVSYSCHDRHDYRRTDLIVKGSTEAGTAEADR